MTCTKLPDQFEIHIFVQIIKGRIEKMKTRTETGKHLLDVCRVLRRERDKERELSMQKTQEAELFERLQVI